MSTPVCLLNSLALQNAYLIVNTQIESTNQTIIFSIDKNTGGIYHAGIPNVDIFPSNEKAIQYLTKIYNLKFDSLGKNNSNQVIVENLGQNLIGATIHDNKLVILCVYQHEQITTLFKQPIYIIKDISYTFLDLNPKSIFSPTNKPHLFYNSYLQLEKSQKMWSKNESFLKFDIRETHFYSPTLDMNSPFPYKQHSITNGSFCWNKRFLIPFEDNNCLKACIIVFQGGVYNFTKENASITYVIKRSSMFPGTRYNTRGLKVISSKKVEPANECECELIFSDGQFYYSQTWRRGSPPIFWKTDMNFLLSSNVLSENASKMTSSYFYQQIIKRFKTSRIQIVSLLSNQENSNEHKFNDAYEEGFKKVEFISKNNEKVHFGFTRFDINNIDKESNRNHSTIAEEMFRMLQNPIEFSDFTKVEISKNEETEIIDTISESISNDKESNNSTTKNNAVKKKLKFNLIPIKTPNKQSVVFRFNCADSLDRTNAGTFFYGVLITAKFAFQKNIYCFMNQKAHQIQSKSKTLWKNPFEYLSDDVINFLKSAFIQSGNIISQLYTSTDAIKSRIIEGGPIEGQTKNDAFISVARRFKNFFVDPNRQQIIDDWTKTFHIKNPRFIIDQQHISFCDGNENINHSIFELNEKDFIINSNGTNITAMFPEPLFLYQISLLVFRRNISENITMTLEIGNNKNEKHIFFKDLLIPTINPKISKKQDPNNCYAWVSYNLRKIASYSNLFPIEPESLKPSSFVNIQFTCKNNDNFRIGTIKFIVKKPNSAAIEQMKRISCLNPQDASTQLLKINNENKYINYHRYMLTSKPIKVDDLDQKQLISKIYDESICKTENKQIDSSLPNLDELMSFLMKWIQYGISDYNHFNVFVDHCTNPWIYDLSSRIRSQKNRNICPICGKKTNSDDIIKLIKESQKENEYDDRELLRKSTVYMPNPVFPMFYIKTINLKLIQNNENNITFLCNECSQKYDDLLKNNNIKPGKNHDINKIEEEEEVKDSDDEINHDINKIEEEEEVKDSDDEINHDINKIEEEEVKDSDDEINSDLINTVMMNKEIYNDLTNTVVMNKEINNEIEEEVQNSDEEDENDLGENDNELDDLAIQSNIISHYINNFVKTSEILNIQQSILPISYETNANDFINNEVVKLNELARIYDYPQHSSSDDLNSVLHSSFLSNHSNVYASLYGTEIEFSVCFALFVNPTEIEFKFDKQPNDEFDLNIKVPGIKEEISVTRKDAQFIYEIKIPKNEKDELKYIQSITFNIKSKKDQTVLNLRLKEINIKGFIDKEGCNYNNNNCEKSCNYNYEVQLPNFSQTKSEKCNLILRTQIFTPSKYLPKKVLGVAISFLSNNYASVPKYFIIAFYNNQKIVHSVPIILPSNVSYAEFLEKDGNSKTQSSQQIEKFYFPIFDQEFHDFDFDLISVFYIEKSSVISQQNFMFF